MEDEELEKLLRDAKAGDREATDRLLVEHLPGLRGFLTARARGAVRERDGVSDLVQSTAREVLQDLPDAEVENVVHFKRWLYQAALHKVTDRFRFWNAQRRDAGRDALGTPETSHSPLSSVLAAGDSPSRIAMDREDLSRIEEALGVLTPEQREVVIMARFLGMTHNDIAAETQRAEGAVRALLHRALSRLRKELGVDDDPTL